MNAFEGRQVIQGISRKGKKEQSRKDEIAFPLRLIFYFASCRGNLKYWSFTIHNCQFTSISLRRIVSPFIRHRRNGLGLSRFYFDQFGAADMAPFIYRVSHGL